MTTFNMSKVEMLRGFMSRRLTAAVEEIFGLFERTIAEYEQELSRSQRDNERQRKLLDAVLKPEVRLHRAVLSEDLPQVPEPPHFKEEHEQFYCPLDGEQLQRPFSFKSEYEEEKAQSSQLHQRQTEENREARPPASSSAQQMDTEGDGQGCGGSEPSRRLDLGSHLQPANEANSSDELKQSRETQSVLNYVKQTETDVSVSQPARDDRTSDSSEAETENSNDDCEDTWEPQTDLKTPNHKGVPRRDKKYNTAKKSVSCSGCGKTLDPKDCAQSHVKSASGKKPLVCSVCVLRSTQTAHLITPKRNHSGERTFMCLVCKKQFSYKGDAVRHVRTHTGEKPFGCSVCGKRFTQSTGLGTHMRTHTGEKPFSCAFCSKRFIQSGILARHMRVHTGEKPYSCSVCNTSFTQSQSLLKHMRIHTGEKPFSCSVCSKRFTQKGNLTQHMTLHTGERSFSCHVCGRKFTRQSRVKNHKCLSENSK